MSNGMKEAAETSGESHTLALEEQMWDAHTQTVHIHNRCSTQCSLAHVHTKKNSHKHRHKHTERKVAHATSNAHTGAV